MSDLERRYVELRADAEGRRLSGVAVTYGDTATLPFGRERIEPGAFAPIGDVILNASHDRTTPLARTAGAGLDLADSAERLAFAATLPATRAADDILALVRSGVMRGASVEMRVTAERVRGGRARDRTGGAVWHRRSRLGGLSGKRSGSAPEGPPRGGAQAAALVFLMADAATIAAVVAGIGGVMLGNADNVTDERRTQVATVACEAVESYAPMAPAATKLEAAMQMASYLIGTQPNASMRKTVDPSGTSLEITHDGQATRNAFRYSRASSLLSPFKRRRAGLIG